ncbi:MAG: hypothetical protein AB1389_09740 [Campylobacterota bacterium]
MRSIIFILIVASYVFGSSYVFLMEKNLDEKELEAKIVSKIGQDALGRDIAVYIPNANDTLKNTYKKFCKVVDDCKEADLIFTPSCEFVNKECQPENKIVLSSNYKDFKKNDNILGVFFWSKARPNIVISGKRMKKFNIKLPDSYSQFIE